MGPGEVILITALTIRKMTGNRVQRNKSEKKEVEGALYQPVFKTAERLFVQPQDRHTAYQTEAHAVVKVVAHIGHTVEMYQIVFAIIDDRQNAIAHRGWKTAIKLLHTMLFQVVDGFFGLAQIRTGDREIFRWVRNRNNRLHDIRWWGRWSSHDKVPSYFLYFPYRLPCVSCLRVFCIF